MNREDITCKIDNINIMKTYDYKTRFNIGNNVYVYIGKKFNWFNKLMIKLIFGIKFEDIKEKK